MKRGQITIFIILGIIILAIIAFLLLLRQPISFEETKITETGAVQEFVQQCVDETAKESVRMTSIEGGYYSPYELAFYPDPSETDLIVPSYFLNGSVLTPTKIDVEQNIADRFEQQLKFCIQYFDSFKGLEVEQGNLTTEVTIQDTQILFSIDYPLKIKKQEETVELNKFNTKVNSDLPTMLNVVNEFMADQQNHQEVFLLSHIGQIAMRNNLTFSNAFTEDGVIVGLKKDNIATGEVEEFWFALDLEEEIFEE